MKVPTLCASKTLFYTRLLNLLRLTRDTIVFFQMVRFDNRTSTVGYVDKDSQGHCISPLLYETGWVPVHISSDNGTTFTRAGSWLSGTRVHDVFQVMRSCIHSFNRFHPHDSAHRQVRLSVQGGFGELDEMAVLRYSRCRRESSHDVEQQLGASGEGQYRAVGLQGDR